uniref:ANK_REP_REGION domain-containing protein n=1 Tax=Syphacia muris TaxID=451379 RepID=A0A0N5AA12_9BILA
MLILDLIQALDNGDMKKVAQLLDSDSIDVSMRDGDDRVALHYAAEVADRETFHRIYNSDPSLIDCEDVNGHTPFLIATMSGNVEVMEDLAENGANVNHCDKNKHFAVHWAVVCGQLDALKLLLRLNANLNAIDSQGAQPLHYATVGEDVAPETCETILNVLLKNGANINSIDFDGRTPLLWATCNGNIKAMTALLQAGANLNVTDRNQLSLLHCATSQGHEDALLLLIEASEPAVIDSTDRNGDTPLFYAVSLGHLQCAKILLIHGANPNYQAYYNFLHNKPVKLHLYYFEAFMQRIAKMDNRLKTPSHCAAAKGQLQMLKLLKHYGVNFEIQNRRGDIPLHEAIQSNTKKKLETIKQLLEPLTPMNLLDVVEWLLLNQPTTVNAVNHSGRSALHLAAASGNMEIVTLLCSRNAEIDALMLSNGKLLTPLDVAEMRKHEDVAEYLRTNYNANRGCNLSDENRLEWITYLEKQISKAKKQNSRRMIIKVEYSQGNNTSKLIQRRHSLEDVIQQTNDVQERPYTVPSVKAKNKENQCAIKYDNSKRSRATSTTDLCQKINENDKTFNEITQKTSNITKDDGENNINTTENEETSRNNPETEDEKQTEDKSITEEIIENKPLCAESMRLNSSADRSCETVDVLRKEVEIETENLASAVKPPTPCLKSSVEEDTAKNGPTGSKTSEGFLVATSSRNGKGHKNKNRSTSVKHSTESYSFNYEKKKLTTATSKYGKSQETKTSSKYKSRANQTKQNDECQINMKSAENKFFYGNPNTLFSIHYNCSSNCLSLLDYSSPESSDNERKEYRKRSPQPRQLSRTSTSQHQSSMFDRIIEKNSRIKLTGSKKLQAQEEAIFQELTNLKKAQIQYGKQAERTVVRTLIKRFCKKYDMEPSQFTCNTYNDWEKLLNGKRMYGFDI